MTFVDDVNSSVAVVSLPVDPPEANAAVPVPTPDKYLLAVANVAFSDQEVPSYPCALLVVFNGTVSDPPIAIEDVEVPADPEASTA